MNVVPTQDRVVIKRDATEQKTKGGIILTKGAQKESNYGTVVSVGPGAWDNGHRRPVRLSVGQRVLFTDYHTTGCGTFNPSTGEDTDLVIADEEDVLAVIEE
jgi:chaperonin GroES